MAFHVGQRVVCVNASLLDKSGQGVLYIGSLDGLREGSVYTVRSVGFDTRFGEVLLELCEIERRRDPGVCAHTNGFKAERFRPLCESRLDQFRAHLAPTSKERVSA